MDISNRLLKCDLQYERKEFYIKIRQISSTSIFSNNHKYNRIQILLFSPSLSEQQCPEITEEKYLKIMQ